MKDNRKYDFLTDAQRKEIAGLYAIGYGAQTVARMFNKKHGTTIREYIVLRVLESERVERRKPTRRPA